MLDDLKKTIKQSMENRPSPEAVKKAIAGLTDAQVKEAVDTFRSFAK